MSEREIADGTNYANAPADIRATAENIAANYSFDAAFLIGAIAAALHSERERCAKIAESHADQTDYDLEPEAAVAESVTARSIASSIRQGSSK